jgi:hypothetical protein
LPLKKKAQSDKDCAFLIFPESKNQKRHAASELHGVQAKTTAYLGSS